MAPLHPTAQGEDRFASIADPPVSKERPATRTLLTNVALLAMLNSTMCEQITSILALVEYTVVRVFGDAGEATESTTDTKMISGIQTVVSRALANGSRIVAFFRSWKKL